MAIEVSTGRLGHLEAVSVRPLVGAAVASVASVAAVGEVAGAAPAPSAPEVEEVVAEPEPEAEPEAEVAAPEGEAVAELEVAVAAPEPEPELAAADEPVRAKIEAAEARIEATRWTVIEPAGWSDSSIPPVDPAWADRRTESAPWPAVEPEAWAEPTAESPLVKRSPVEETSEWLEASSAESPADAPAGWSVDWSADPLSGSGGNFRAHRGALDRPHGHHAPRRGPDGFSGGVRFRARTGTWT